MREGGAEHGRIGRRLWNASILGFRSKRALQFVANPRCALAGGKVEPQREAVAARSQLTVVLQYVRQAFAAKRVHLHAVVGHEAQAHAGHGAQRAQVHQAVAEHAIVAVFAGVRGEAGGGAHELPREHRAEPHWHFRTCRHA